MDKWPTKHESFIVRFWREESHAGWRGWVQHTRSGEVTVVRSMEELVAFFEDRFGTLGGGSPRGLK